MKIQICRETTAYVCVGKLRPGGNDGNSYLLSAETKMSYQWFVKWLDVFTLVMDTMSESNLYI